MACALCLADRPLRESHIIPEFMYQALYDDIHRFHVLSKEPQERNKLFQKGLREALLCDDCEQYMGRYERYMSLFLGGELDLEYETGQASYRQRSRLQSRPHVSTLNPMAGWDFKTSFLFSSKPRASSRAVAYFASTGCTRHSLAVRMPHVLSS